MNERDRNRGWGHQQQDPQTEAPDSAEQLADLRMQVARQRKVLQRKVDRGAREASGGIRIPEGGGAPLSGDLRGKMEGALGGDFADVKVHTGGESAQAASQMGARAFTDGRDIHFNSGQFAPGTKEGDRLLAHELTHVVQGQKTGIQRKAAEGEEAEGEEKEGAEGGGELEVSQPDEPAEQEADAHADKVADDLHEGGDEKKDEKGKKKKKGEEEGEEKEGADTGEADAAGGKSEGGDEAKAAGADAAGETKAAPAPIAAKLQGVGRKIFRQVATGTITDKYHVGGGNPAQAAGAFNLGGQSTATNPQFEAAAIEFEKKLGAVAFGRGQGIGANVIGKMRSYLQTKVDTSKLDQMDAEVVKMMQTCIEGSKMATDPSFAGNVKPQDVQQILMGKQQLEQLKEQIAAARGDAEKLKNLPEPPNVREQMTMFYHFSTNILTKDILNAAQSKQGLEKLVGDGKMNQQEIEKRIAFMKEQAEKRKQGGPDQMKRADGPGGQSSWDLVGGVPKTGNAEVATDPNASKETQDAAGTATAVGGQWSARENRKTVEGSAGKPKEDQTSTNDPNRKAGDVAGEGTPLSGREMQMQGLTGNGDPVKWSEGARMWIINEKDNWCNAMRQLSLPLAAGPSGTTNVLMNANAMLGAVSAPEMRLAAMGYLLPIHAHSLVEICAAAAAHGVPFTAGKQLYHNLPPLDPEELRAQCGRQGTKVPKKLFPDEPDEAPANAAGPNPAAAPTAKPGGPASPKVT